MKIKKHIMFLVTSLCLVYFSISKISAQQKTELTMLSVSFDSTATNGSPLFLYCEFDNGNDLLGLSITLSDTNEDGTNLLSDTLYIIGGHGSFRTVFHNVTRPAMGRTFSREIPVNVAARGLLYCTITPLYRNGTTGDKKRFRVKK